MLDVYKTRYLLSGEPFRLGPDHHFSFAHSSYANAEAYLKYAISQGEGFIAITGGPGAGKTTLVNALLAELDKTQIHIAVLKNAQLDPGNLIRMVADSFGLHVKDSSYASILPELEHFLQQEIRRGRRAVLIVDEAQGLSSASLEELRLLSNMQLDDRLLLQVFLVGQEQLLDLIHAPGMEHLLQRLIAASMIKPLDIDETVSYVEHRLCHVGWQGDPSITEDALRLIHKFSGGVPRRINLICHRLFLYGGLGQKHTFDGEDARHVIEELQQERLLTAEVPVELSAEEEALAGSGSPDLPPLYLPRTESPVSIENPDLPANQPEPAAPVADNIVTLTQPISLPPQHIVYEASPRTPGEANQARQAVEEPSGESVPTGPDADPGNDRDWRLATVLGILAGLVLIVAIETGVSDRLANSRHDTPITAENRFAVTDSAPEKKHVAFTFQPTAEATNDHGQPLTTKSGGTSNIQRDAVLATTSPDPKDAVTGSPGGKASGYEPAEQHGSVQHVAARILADQEQLKEKNRQQILSAKEQQVRLDVWNRQIELEQEETLRKARQAVALATPGKSEHETESTIQAGGTTVENQSPQATATHPPRELAEASAATRRVQQEIRPAFPGKGQLKSLLLAGRWNSEGKPAVLLPSDVTYCKSGDDHINCWSIPQNSNGNSGPALYKVEATLRGFSTEDSFQIYFRTLMKPRDNNNTAPAPTKGHWQATEHAMECRFIQANWVQCHDENDITSNFQQSGFTERSYSSL